MTRKSRRARKPRIDPVAKVALSIGVPKEQLANDNFERVDVQNWTEGDQRRTVRSGERQTIRRMPKVAELHRRGIIDKQELAACEWYVTQHEFERQRIRIAQWDSEGGCASDKAFGHWAPGRILEPGQSEFEFARAGINRFLLPMFERVVLHHRPLGRLTRSFRLAIHQLIERIEGRVQL